MWTFAFDRRAQVTTELLEKAHTAVAERAVMVSTPAAVKAFMLKLLELLHLLDSGQYPRNHSGLSHRVRRMLGLRSVVLNVGSVDKDALHMQAGRAVQLQQVWRRAVAVIDEVDVVLHPLRSELNWPLGDKYALDFAPLTLTLTLSLTLALALTLTLTLTRYALDFAPHRWELPWHLLDAVLSLQPAPADAAASASASASASAASTAATAAAAPTPGVGGSATSKEAEVLERLPLTLALALALALPLPLPLPLTLLLPLPLPLTRCSRGCARRCGAASSSSYCSACRTWCCSPRPTTRRRCGPNPHHSTFTLTLTLTLTLALSLLPGGDAAPPR